MIFYELKVGDLEEIYEISNKEFQWKMVFLFIINLNKKEIIKKYDS